MISPHSRQNDTSFNYTATWIWRGALGFIAIRPAATDFCPTSAKETDTALAEITPELYKAIRSSPNPFRFDCSLHRDDHLGEIARLLGR